MEEPDGPETDNAVRSPFAAQRLPWLGGFVGMGLPVLDTFLNGNGTAYADEAKLPVRFGTYFWGLGLTPGRWVPKTVGANWELTPELQSLDGLQKKVSVFSGFRVHLDAQAEPAALDRTGRGALGPKRIAHRHV